MKPSDRHARAGAALLLLLGILILIGPFQTFHGLDELFTLLSIWWFPFAKPLIYLPIHFQYTVYLVATAGLIVGSLGIMLRSEQSRKFLEVLTSASLLFTVVGIVGWIPDISGSIGGPLVDHIPLARLILIPFSLGIGILFMCGPPVGVMLFLRSRCVRDYIAKSQDDASIDNKVDS